MAQVVYSPTALVGTTKKGKLNCDPDGYYDVCVGGFDTYNSAGAFYTFSSAQSHFDTSHDFQRRIKNGALFGENGHPVYNPALSKKEWLIRVLTLDPNNKSHHIRELTLDDTVFKNKDGKPMVAVFARVKPAGPHAQALGDSLDNPNENTAFSIRSITQDHIDPRTGTVIKEMQAIATYDWVPEPGISNACKYLHPGLEGHQVAFSSADITGALNTAKDMYSGFEDSDNGLISSLETLSSGLIVPKQNPKIQIVSPNWSKWY